jgi:hypothetical protein
MSAGSAIDAAAFMPDERGRTPVVCEASGVRQPTPGGVNAHFLAWVGKQWVSLAW